MSRRGRWIAKTSISDILKFLKSIKVFISAERTMQFLLFSKSKANKMGICVLRFVSLARTLASPWSCDDFPFYGRKSTNVLYSLWDFHHGRIIVEWNIEKKKLVNLANCTCDNRGVVEVEEWQYIMTRPNNLVETRKRNECDAWQKARVCWQEMIR